jgi:GNAT superfamily N-acetyltransferase
VAIDVHPLTQQDKPRVMHILHHTPEFKPSEVAVAEELMDYYLSDSAESGYHVLVAEADLVVQGYVCFGPTPLAEGVWDIYWIAVSPDARGKGLGQALMKSAEDKIRRAGARMVIIETSSLASYAKTRRFYELGKYKTIARVPDFYEPGDDKLILQKRFT